MASAERRKSDRVMLVFPLQLQGEDAKGQPFQCEAQTVDVSRDGARIQGAQPLNIGQIVHVVNLASHREADFRVAAQVRTSRPDVIHYCLECANAGEKVWGTVFPTPAERKASELRRHQRISLRLPVLIRDFMGDVERAETENVSKGGFSFSTETNYQVGEKVSVACPYSETSPNIEVPARIIRWISIEGTKRNIYGVRYEPQGS